MSAPRQYSARSRTVIYDDLLSDVLVISARSDAQQYLSIRPGANEDAVYSISLCRRRQHRTKHSDNTNENKYMNHYPLHRSAFTVHAFQIRPSLSAQPAAIAGPRASYRVIRASLARSPDHRTNCHPARIVTRSITRAPDSSSNVHLCVLCAPRAASTPRRSATDEHATWGRRVFRTTAIASPDFVLHFSGFRDTRVFIKCVARSSMETGSTTNCRRHARPTRHHGHRNKSSYGVGL